MKYTKRTAANYLSSQRSKPGFNFIELPEMLWRKEKLKVLSIVVFQEL